MPSGSATSERDPERGARELELLERLRREEAGMVADEAERVDERVQVGGVGERSRAAPRHEQRGGARRAATSQASASPTASAPAE